LVLDALIVILALVTYIGATTDEIHIVRHGKVLLDFSRSYFPATLLAICVVIRLAIRFPRALSEGNLRTAIANSRFSFELWAAALWIVIGFLGSFGIHAFFQSFLFQRVFGFRAIRAPARWAAIAYAGLACWSATGASILGRRKWVTALLFAAAFVDVWPRIRWEQALVGPAPLDRWIAQTHAGPLIEPVFHIGAHYGRGRLRTQCQRTSVAIVERVHLLGNDVGVFSHAAREELCLLQDRGPNLVIVVRAKYQTRRGFHVVPNRRRRRQ